MSPLRAGDGVAFDELLRYEREELERWEAFFLQHPEALDLPFAPAPGSSARMATVRHVVHHIVGAEWRYCDRLAGVSVTDFEAIPSAPLGTLFEAARVANVRLGAWAAGASGADWSREIEFHTISAGTMRASARLIVVHALLHGIRTWAQLATVVRMHGVPTRWRHDALFSEAFGSR